MPRDSQAPEITRAMTAYLTERLCPAMGIAAEFDEIEAPTFGVKSNVLLVRPRGAAPFALRLLPEMEEAERLLRIERLAEAERLPTARILHQEVTKEHMRKFGFVVIAEQLLEGVHLLPGAATDAQLAGLAETFARLHAVRAGRWGAPDGQSGGAFFDKVVLKKIENRLDSATKHDEDFERRWRGAILDFAKAFRSGWEGGPPFSLTHDKVNTGNVLFDGERASLIDLESLRYAEPWKDFTALLYYFCDGPAQEETLKRLYFARMGGGASERFAKAEPLFRVWHHLSRWAAKSRDMAALRRKGKPGAEEMAESRRREREAVWRWMAAR